MARFWTVALLTILFVATFVIFTKSPAAPPLNQPVPSTPAPTSLPQPLIKFNSQTYNYNLIRIHDPDSLKLIDNHKNKLITSELMRLHNCTAGVNGGFYAPAGESLGLLIIGGATIYPAIKSPLLNGFLDLSDPPAISTSLPSSSKNVLQNGPLLFIDKLPQLLKINNDEPARRIVSFITTDNLLIFAAIYDPQSPFSGPFLSDLPQILELIGVKEKLNIVNSLNLDGGSASAFYNDTIRLQELKSVGTFICYTQ